MRRKGVIGPKGGLRRNPIAWLSQPPDIMDTWIRLAPRPCQAVASHAGSVARLTPSGGFISTSRRIARLPLGKTHISYVGRIGTGARPLHDELSTAATPMARPGARCAADVAHYAATLATYDPLLILTFAHKHDEAAAGQCANRRVGLPGLKTRPRTPRFDCAHHPVMSVACGPAGGLPVDFMLIRRQDGERNLPRRHRFRGDGGVADPGRACDASK
jgi:hypothetical protein